MTPIEETIQRRAAENRIDSAALPGVVPFARRHVEQLQTAGKIDLVLRQLIREAQSVRRTRSEAALLALVPGFNVDKFQEGFDALCDALATGKKTKLKVSKWDHKGGQFNPVNALTEEEQATAAWAGVCSLVGELADNGGIGKVTTQKLAKAVAGKLREATENAPEYGRLGYERAALVLIDHLCAYTGWLEEVDIGRKLVSVEQEPKRVALTKKFIAEALGGQELPADISERKPMLVPPVPWTTAATHGGYLHNGIPAVRGTREAIESPVIVSALNLLQAAPFRVNARVFAVAKSFRINADDLPTNLIHGHLWEERHDISADVQRSMTIRSALTLGAFEELKNAEEFYFPWNLDWRGRMYPATSLISPQGADLCKGCLEFVDGTPLGRDGGDWLAITLCNLAGADKEIVEQGDALSYRTRTPAERIEWTRSRSALIEMVAADPLGNRGWHLEGGFGREKIKRGKRVAAAVDSPWQFLATCFEWADFQQEGPGFRSRLAGALDGSCSGVQMLAGMTRDPRAGAMVNLVPAPRGDDYYGRMADALTKRLCDLVDGANEQTMEHLKYWSSQTIDRDLLKAPSMTKVYSAKPYSFAIQVQEKTNAPPHECKWIAERINECFADVVPGMLQAMSYLQAVTDVLTAENIALHWTTPAGLRVEQARVKTNVVRLEANVGERRTRTFHVDADELSKLQQRSGVSPNFVHGVDASHMAMTVNALGAQGVRNLWMVHDSFGAPFANCQQVFDTTRDQFVKLMSGDLLQKWTDDVTEGLPDAGRGKLPNLPNYGALDLAAVRQSIYAWY